MDADTTYNFSFRFLGFKFKGWLRDNILNAQCWTMLICFCFPCSVFQFETVPDPELPGHFLLEQYQVS